MYLKKDGVFTSCFVGQILCICKFMVLIVGVVVLKGKNGRVTKSFKKLQVWTEIYHTSLRMNQDQHTKYLNHDVQHSSRVWNCHFTLLWVSCSYLRVKYFISYFSVNVKTVIGQFGGSYSLGQVKKKKIKPINNSLPGSFQGNLLAEHTRFRQCLVLEDVW